MLGIKEIGKFIAQNRISNYTKKETFNIDDFFIKEKIGFETLSLKNANEKSSDLCCQAFANLKEKTEIKNIECLIFVSQNPDCKIPHTSAILQDKLQLSKNCACFDIGLGCSGYIYGLASIIAFMQLNDFKNGLLFTCDPYSNIINPDDKNTSLLFGDAASVSYITTDYKYKPKAFKFGTDGNGYKNIFCENEYLTMQGREVFNFAATVIPKHIEEFLQIQKLTKEDIDFYLFHQGSKYIIDTLANRLKIEKSKIPFLAGSYGNTISSSIPLMLESLLKENKYYNKILMCGFGAGLSWGSSILTYKG